MVGHQRDALTAFTSGGIPGTHFQRLSRSQGTWFCRGYHGKKSPVTPPGIDPGTVRLVAQRLNHYATPDPTVMIISPRILHKTGNISDKRRANQNVFYVQHIFLKFRNAYEIKSKNFVDPARPEALCVLDNYGHKITFFFFNRHCNPCGF